RRQCGVPQGHRGRRWAVRGPARRQAALLGAHVRTLTATRARRSERINESKRIETHRNEMVPSGTSADGTRADVGSADDALERLGQLACLISVDLDNEPASAFKRDPHDDAAPFLGDLERTVASTRLHGRHARTPFLSLCATTPPRTGVMP